MASSFQHVGLAYEQFEPFFQLSDEHLKTRGAERCIATESPGFPCRVSLEDAAAGEELLLLSHVHQAAMSPYRASGPIFVRRGATQRQLPAGAVPSCVASRLISVRAYDAEHLIVAATVCEGGLVGREIELFFSDPQASYIHLHNAKRGCFSCKVLRA